MRRKPLRRIVPEWARRPEEPKPSRCPCCEESGVILIYERGEGGEPNIWYCMTTMRMFMRSEVDGEVS